MEAMVRIALLVFGGLVLLAILLDGVKRNREKAAYMRRIDLDLPPKARLDIFDEAEKEALRSMTRQNDRNIHLGAEETVTLIDPPPVIRTVPVEKPVAAPAPVVEKAAEPIIATEKAPEPMVPDLLMLSVMAKHRGIFSGKAVLESMHLMGLELDRNGIFQRFANGQPQQGIQFCVVQAVEPGTFDKFTLERSVTPGLSLFMSLPGPRAPMQAFDEMLRTARTLASRLGGELKNHKREPLTSQSLQSYRERIRAIEGVKEAEAVE